MQRYEIKILQLLNAGFLLNEPLGMDLSRVGASSTVQSRAANYVRHFCP
jgi:hypothetical protein